MNESVVGTNADSYGAIRKYVAFHQKPFYQAATMGRGGHTATTAHKIVITHNNKCRSSERGLGVNTIVAPFDEIIFYELCLRAMHSYGKIVTGHINVVISSNVVVTGGTRSCVHHPYRY